MRNKYQSRGMTHHSKSQLYSLLFISELFEILINEHLYHS